MIHSCAFARNYTKKLLRLKDTFYQFFYQFFRARHRDFRGRATHDCSPVRFLVRGKAYLNTIVATEGKWSEGYRCVFGRVAGTVQ